MKSNKKRTKLTLSEVETQMEVLTKEEMNVLKGGGEGTYGSPYTIDEYYALLDSNSFYGGYVVGWGYVNVLEGVEVTGSYQEKNGITYGPFTTSESWRYNSYELGSSLWYSGFPAPFHQPEGVTVYGNTLNSIRFSSSANMNAVSQYSLQVLSDILQDENILITSTSRDAYNQARIMYENIVATGVSAQMSIYGSGGDSVINVYSPNSSREENIQNMAAHILSIGASRVSRHCSDYNQLNVIDIAKSSIQDIEGFKSRLRNAGIYFLDENGCIHIEIPQ